MSLQSFFAKPCTNLADGLELFRVAVVASKEKSSIHICSFAFAIVSPDDDEVQRVSHSSKVVFLELLVIQMVQLQVHAWSQQIYLQPVDTSTTGFIETCIRVKHFDHKAFTAIFNALFQKTLYFFRGFAIRRLGKIEFPWNNIEMLL